MPPEFVTAASALLYFWEDFALKLDVGTLPVLWKVLLETRTRLENRIGQVNEEQRVRLEKADATVRKKLVPMLKKEGLFGEYCLIRRSKDVSCWWHYLEEEA